MKACEEHDLPWPCLRCALLCSCGCGMLRDGVSVDVWEAALEVEPFIRVHAREAAARRATMTDRTISVDLTVEEIQVLYCAMAGNFPPKLNGARMPTLRKLAKADRTLRRADEAEGRAA